MQLYNWADTVIVGRYVGKQALAAVGASAPFVFMLVALVMGIGIGTTIIISQAYGLRDYDKIRKASDSLYLFLTAAELWSLIRVTGVKLSLGRLFLKPLGCAILCGCAAWCAHRGLTRLGLGSGPATALGIFCGGAVYLAGLLFSHALAKKDLMMLPKGQKIAKTLEKRGWM